MRVKGEDEDKYITKRDLATWVVCGLVIIFFVYLHECGYDVGVIIGTCVFLFLAGGTFLLWLRDNKSKSIAIEYPNDWEEIRIRILKRDSFTCCNCGDADTILHVHHVVPLSSGGTSTDSNLISLCENCHISVHAHMR